jgi:FlaA1/EpsC-like NDP-sugar epimerase
VLLRRFARRRGTATATEVEIDSRPRASARHDRNLLVTGGAGVIGSNFVRRALRDAARRIVVSDKLGYSGNRESLADVAGDHR